MPVEIEHAGYTLSDDVLRIDFAKVTEWLTATYWSPGIGRAEVERGARHSSLVIGAYDSSGAQVAYGRIASDRTRFGYFMDVFVDPAHRKRGLGRALVRFGMDHPEHRPVYLWLLATHDAHGVYAELGFGPLTHPERIMALRRERPKP
jgi:GNAT superfamily N-acetyltransferase